MTAAWRLDVGWSKQTGPFLNEVEAVGADWSIWGWETPPVAHDFTVGVVPCIAKEISDAVDEEMTLAQVALLQLEKRATRSSTCL